MIQLTRVKAHIKNLLADKNLRFSYMPLMIKAVSLALKEYPVLNAHVDPDCTKITYKSDHNIGVAMDTPLGLVVPNVKQVQVQRHSYIDIVMCSFLSSFLIEQNNIRNSSRT